VRGTTATDAGGNTLSSHADRDLELDVLEQQTEDEMVADVVVARHVGTVRRGGVKAARTDPAVLGS
jgi:hypothetical protein